ncbi:hexokinase family protein [Acetonema longum]|uniref:Hexokinase n=1 Tax=Acetonema longum DSM 6540 TaxID=1009370 RepID=F7NFZ7_9FIRM|nr:hexokinase [Acetonema longum]EGO65026.1 Hexokinase [Acetonema longum DSM 6540]
MSNLTQAIRQLQEEFSADTPQLHSIAADFRRDMINGLAGRPSSLAMLPSFLTRPSGQEQGIFLALDFGGTNIRALAVELLGNGSFQIRDRQALPLVDPAGGYNLIADSATAEELFGFLASQLAKLIPSSDIHLLGHTFSFPCRQTSANDAILLYWTKEIKTSGVEGRDIVQLLNTALSQQGLSHIRPVVILNDTVSALIAAAYSDIRTDIGSICGTGHNTCYLEPTPPQGTQPMYINLESGNFDKIPGNIYDIRLDRHSERPGTGRLEKMCSGRYIGELVRLVILGLMERDLIWGGRVPAFFAAANILSGEDLALFLSDATPRLERIAAWLNSRDPAAGHTLADRSLFKTVASLVVTRSARLAAVTYTAALRHMDPDMSQPHTIAIDGSLYEKMPGYAQTIHTTLGDLLGEKSGLVRCRLAKDGSGVGAAVAAAICGSFQSADPAFSG